MTTLPPYFQSELEHKKWEEGFKAGLKESVPDLHEILEETTDSNTAEQIVSLLSKIDRRIGS